LTKCFYIGIPGDIYTFLFLNVIIHYFFRTLITHASVSPEERSALNISDNLINLSVGLESEEYLIADLDQALKASVKN